MYYFVEIIIALIITLLFIKFKKPKLTFLFLGYFFVLVTIVLQIPFKYLKIKILEIFPINFEIPILIITILTIIITELVKYFSLKKFLKTRSFKNAILFGIGWVSLQSINLFYIIIYGVIFSFIPINFNFTPLLNENLALLSFIFFFIINLSITVLVILSIIKKNWHYLFFAIIYHTLVIILIEHISSYERYVFMILMFIYSLYIIFKYNKLK